jgi:hypothetical protein
MLLHESTKASGQRAPLSYSLPVGVRAGQSMYGFPRAIITGSCREAALTLMKAVMSKFLFGIYTKEGRFIERIVDALNEEAARELALEGFAGEEIRLCMVDAEPEGDPKRREALIEALFDLARQGTRR